jgi:hypothetical protein
MSATAEPRVAASLAGVRIERVFIDDAESSHLTRDDITHYREAMAHPTTAASAPSQERSGGLDTAGIAGLVTLCVAAFVAVMLL